MFWNGYDANKVTQAQRPFAFIDFDATIEKNRRKSNKKQLDIDDNTHKEIESELTRHPAQVVSDKARVYDVYYSLSSSTVESTVCYSFFIIVLTEIE